MTDDPRKGGKDTMRTERPIAWDDEPPARRAILLALDKLDLAGLGLAARAMLAEGLHPDTVRLMLRVAMIRALVAGGVLTLDPDDEEATP
jgi:hypothetical protein